MTAPCCVRCGKALPYLAYAHHDVYCSTVCCRAAHGVEDQWIGDPRRVKHGIDDDEQAATPMTSEAR